MKSYHLFVLAGLFFIACSNTEQKPLTEKIPRPSGNYFGLSVDTTAQMFAEGIISKAYQELNAVFSPDGKEFYYTIADPGRSFYTIFYYKQNEKATWDGPFVAPFSGKYSDADPFITSDGKQLYFISRRPIDQSSKEPKDFDIWMVERTESGWSEAQNLGAPINTSTNEFYVSVTDEGSIFYSAAYDDAIGRSDIYEAKPTDQGYVVENLGPNINSPTGEGDPYVSPDGKMIIFMSWGRSDDLGRGDLYISFKEEGAWKPAVNLGKRINSEFFEYCPMLSPDGQYFFWTSYQYTPFQNAAGWDYEGYAKRLESADNSLGNVYWIAASVLEEYR